jgi:hypothetical protein
VLSIALLALVLWKVPLRDALQGLSGLSPVALVSLLVLTFVFPSVAALRWKRVLLRLQLRQRWIRLLADTLVSSTYNMLLPTSIGGDIVRGWRCARRVEAGHHAWSSVLYERLVGLVALALLALPGLFLTPTPAGRLGAVVAVLVAVSILLAVFAHAPFRHVAHLLAVRAPVVAGVGDGIAADLSGPLARSTARAETLAWSLLYQFVGLGLLIVVVLDWNRPELVPAVLGAVPIALIFTMLPVSIAGLGVRESLFVVLLGQFGVEAARALSLALVWLASAVVLAGAGAAVMIVEASRPAVRSTACLDSGAALDRSSASIPTNPGGGP